MWYQAIAGSLVMVGAYGFGMAMCQDMRCLLYHLKEQKRMLLYFERETDFLHRPIQESFDAIAERLLPPYQEFALAIVKGMRQGDGRSFREIWQHETSRLQASHRYPSVAIKYLYRIGDGIGSEEDELQVELCVLLRKELEEEVERLKAEKAQKGRVIHTMSLVCGILCVVLFL
ncbi:MAG: stage III sporulation protein AB [Lachnospiraceae bacterium]|nr:stage III sporulation protein AB [Lachnospiraceae bacterium]